MFFCINLAYATDTARVIIQKEETKNDDFVINVLDGEYLDNQSILDTITKKNEKGFLIKDNLGIVIHLAERNIISNSCSIEYFYYDTINNRNIKIRTKSMIYFFDTPINIVPEHSYNYLKTSNKFSEKTFVLKINYDKKILKDNTIASTNIIDNNNFNNQESIVEQDYDIEQCSKNLYFKLISDEEYNAYLKIKKEAENLLVKDGPIKIKNRH